jgi:hypothetical protein
MNKSTSSVLDNISNPEYYNRYIKMTHQTAETAGTVSLDRDQDRETEPKKLVLRQGTSACRSKADKKGHHPHLSSAAFGSKPVKGTQCLTGALSLAKHPPAELSNAAEDLEVGDTPSDQAEGSESPETRFAAKIRGGG